MSDRALSMHAGIYAGAAIFAVLLTGCGEVAYNWGGGNDQLLAAKHACADKHEDIAAYDSCMSAKGWSVAHWDDDKPAPMPEAVAPASVSASASTSSTIAAPGQATGATASGEPTHAAPAMPSAPDPTQPVVVTSWWKMGGSDFKGTMSACVETLGPQHAPDTTHHTVTRAVLSCMTQHGWRAL